jgi:hypothetical protein
LKTFDREKKERKGDRPVAIKEKKKRFSPKMFSHFTCTNWNFRGKKIPWVLLYCSAQHVILCETGYWLVAAPFS